MKITFLGAVGEVTGSQHLIETDRRRILLDCGLFQGHRAESYARNRRIDCSPEHLDAVILSHGHIDHCGNLPGLYRAGFSGPIFSTDATADVASVMLQDSARIQQEDARYLSGQLQAGHPPVEPLYDLDDAKQICRQFEPLEYGAWHELAPDVHLRLSDAGHILGSAICELRVKDGRDTCRVVFTGDLGRRGMPLLPDPILVSGCDVLISESTYGNHVHRPVADIKSRLLEIANRAAKEGGRVVIPAFSLGRTQLVVYFLNQLAQEGLLPPLPVFVDSPLSNRLTSVYRRHQHLLNAQSLQFLAEEDEVFEFPSLHYVRTQRESMELNHLRDAFIVITASGMCESGRVRHHLKHAVDDPRNTILLIGFQARHTLGRRLTERPPTVRIFDRDLPLRADVVNLSGLSAHADAEDFRWWFGHMASEGGVGQAFLVHGEDAASRALASLIRDCCDEEPVIPEPGMTYDVELPG